MKRAIIFIIGLTVFGSVNAQNIIRPKIYCPNGIAINSYSGVLTYNRTDVSIPGRSMPLAASFYYNSSANEENYRYGNGWSLGYEFRYKTSNNDSVITIRYGNGRGEDYNIHEGVYEPPVGVFNTLTYQGGVVTLTTKEGLVYRFEDAESKKLTGLADRNGNAIHFEYTGGKLTRMSDDAGRGLVLEYNAEGYLSRLTDPAGRQWHYAYDENGNLTSVTNPANHSVHYGYNKENRLSTFTDPEGHSTWVTYNKDGQAHRVQTELTDKSIRYEKRQHQTVIVDYMGEDPEHPGQELPNQFTTYKWDTLGRVIEKTGNCCGSVAKYEYDENNNVLKSEDANGNVTEYTYDDNGNVLSIKDPLGYTKQYTYNATPYSLPDSFRDKTGNLYTFSYDNRGNQTQITTPDNAVTTMEYNSYGQVIRITDVMGNQTTSNYDGYGNLASVTDPMGNSRTYTYDNLGRCTTSTDSYGRTITYAYNQEGDLVSITNPYNEQTLIHRSSCGPIQSIQNNRGTIHFVHNALGHLIQCTDLIGNTTKYSFNAKGKVNAVIDVFGNIDHYAYDERNRLSTYTDALGNTINYTYDGIGNLLGMDYSNGHYENYTYDNRNQVTEASDQDGLLYRITYDPIGRPVQVQKVKTKDDDNYTFDTYTYTYDIKGNLTSIQTPYTTTNYTYDLLGRCTSATDADGNNYTYTYDAPGRLLSMSDPRGNTFNYTYDGHGRMLTQSDNQGHTTSFTYNDEGNLASVTDALGHTTQYQYQKGRVTEITYPNGKTEKYTYSSAGDLILYKGQDGSNIHYTYDQAHRLTTREYPDGSSKQYTYDAAGQILSVSDPNTSISRTYDALGRIITETTIEGTQSHTTTYAYDDLNRSLSITYPSGRTVSYSYDLRSRLSAIEVAEQAGDVPQSAAQYAFNHSDKIESIVYGNGIISDYGYDSKNRLESLLAAAGEGAPVQRQHWNHNSLGDILSKVDQVNMPNSEFYQYDNFSRLTQFAVGSPDNTLAQPAGQATTEQFAYDALGNRTGSQYGAVNAVNGYTTVGGQALQYDGNGNLSSDGVHTYQYDYANRLVSVDNGATATYGYDPLGRRIRKVAGGVTTDYSYSGNQMIESTTGGVTTSYVYSPNVDDVLMAIQGDNKYYYHKDHLGSTMAVTNEGGNVEERYRYEPFGKPYFYNASGEELSASAIGNDLLFTGREYDRETGLYYYRVRTMNPTAGRFMQQDPIGYGAGLNFYAYVQNNPITFYDPSGLKDCNGNCENSNKPYYCSKSWMAWMCDDDNFTDWSLDIKSGLGGSAAGGIEVGGDVTQGFNIQITKHFPYFFIEPYTEVQVRGGAGYELNGSLRVEGGVKWNGAYKPSKPYIQTSYGMFAAVHGTVAGGGVEVNFDKEGVESWKVNGGAGKWGGSVGNEGISVSYGLAKDVQGFGFSTGGQVTTHLSEAHLVLNWFADIDDASNGAITEYFSLWDDFFRLFDQKDIYYEEDPVYPYNPNPWNNNTSCD